MDGDYGVRCSSAGKLGCIVPVKGILKRDMFCFQLFERSLKMATFYFNMSVTWGKEFGVDDLDWHA